MDTSNSMVAAKLATIAETMALSRSAVELDLNVSSMARCSPARVETDRDIAFPRMEATI